MWPNAPGVCCKTGAQQVLHVLATDDIRALSTCARRLHVPHWLDSMMLSRTKGQSTQSDLAWLACLQHETQTQTQTYLHHGLGGVNRHEQNAEACCCG